MAASYFKLLKQDESFIKASDLAQNMLVKGQVGMVDGIHDNPPGINGWLVEGRVRYDAFVLENKKGAIYVHKTAAE